MSRTAINAYIGASAARLMVRLREVAAIYVAFAKAIRLRKCCCMLLLSGGRFTKKETWRDHVGNVGVRTAAH